MSRAERKLQRDGVKAFDMCDVKVVKMVKYGYPVDTEVRVSGDEFIVPLVATDYTKRFIEGEDESSRKNHYAGSRAIIECPYTEDTGITLESQFDNHNGELRAYESIRKNAGVLACRTCQYSGMTPVEVSIARTEFAKAEAERIKAFELLEEARAEIAQLANPKIEI